MIETNTPAQLIQGVIQQIGEVERHDAGTVVVSTSAGIQRAHLAASCLMQPESGDVVLVAAYQDQFFVLSVLLRHSQSPIVLRTDRTTHLEIGGDLRVSVAASSDWRTQGACTIHAQKLSLEAEDTEITTQRLALWTRTANWVADALEITAEKLRQVTHSMTMQTRGYQRHVQDLEVARVGHLDVRARELLQLSATHTVIKSSELVKIDGKQIQVG